MHMPDRGIPRERVTSPFEPRFLTHRSRGDTRGPSRGRPRAHGITAVMHSDTQRLPPITRPPMTDTRCPSHGSQHASFGTHCTHSNSRGTSSATPRPPATTSIAGGTTLRTWSRRSDLRGPTTRPPRCRTRANSYTPRAPSPTALALGIRRRPSLRTTGLRRKTRHPRLHTSGSQPDTHRPESHTSFTQFNRHGTWRITRHPPHLTTVPSSTTLDLRSMPWVGASDVNPDSPHGIASNAQGAETVDEFPCGARFREYSG